jgi:AraC-like DNA-binding protein
MEARPAPVVITLVRRERVRTVLRAHFPRKRAQLLVARSVGEVVGHLRQTLVDAVVLDVGAGEEAVLAAAQSADFPTHPFIALAPGHAGDAPAVGRLVAAGVSEVLLDGIDDALLRDRVVGLGFSRRFAAAFEEPPAVLGLAAPLQREVWARLVAHGGRPVRTDRLAEALGISREHLSRSFARPTGGAEGPTLKRVIDLVRLLAAAALAKNPGYDLRDVAQVLGFASTSHLSVAVQRLVGAKAPSLARLRSADLVDRFIRGEGVPRGVVDGGAGAGAGAEDAEGEASSGGRGGGGT